MQHALSFPPRARAGRTSRLGALALVTGLAACAPQVSQQDFGAFRSAVATGNYQTAATVATALAAPQADGSGTELLWTLNAGVAQLHAGSAPQATSQFDAADRMITASEAANFDWSTRYRFGGYDSVMVHTYGTLAMLARGDTSSAGVEARRAYQRQARVAQRFESEIASEQERLRRDENQEQSKQKSLSNANADPAVQGELQALARVAYRPFVNPAASYIEGIILLARGAPGDAEAARNEFQRVSGIVGARNQVVNDDLALATSIANGRAAAGAVRYTWVLFENGQSPTFKQQNITVPMPVASTSGGVTVRPITVSLPSMVYNPNAYETLDIEAGRLRANTLGVGSIEAVMAGEFRVRYPNLVAGAVFEALAKAVGTSVVNATLGRRAGNLGFLVDAATTAAANVTSSDTRSWHLLPREFQAVRVQVPADGTIRLLARGGAANATVTVPTDRPSIIHVKAQDPGSPLVAQVYRL